MECRSRGIGHALLDFLKKRHRFLLLHVYEKNSRAVAFYRREGFECRDRHVEGGYRGNGVDNGMDEGKYSFLSFFIALQVGGGEWITVNFASLFYESF